MNSKVNELTLTGHFQELKVRVVRCVLVFVGLFFLCYLKATPIVKFLLKAGEDAGFTLSYISPQEILVQSLRVAGVVAMILSLPVIAWNIFAFISPAVDKKKNRIVIGICTVTGFVLFAAGIVFCIYILFPFVYQYLYQYSSEFGVKGYVSVEKYLSMFLATTKVMGILFDFPLACAGLANCGILTAGNMKKAFKPAVIVILIVSAIITPPDVLSMLIVAVPMLGIYVVSIGVCKVFQKKDEDEK